MLTFNISPAKQANQYNNTTCASHDDCFFRFTLVPVDIFHCYGLLFEGALFYAIKCQHRSNFDFPLSTFYSYFKYQFSITPITYSSEFSFLFPVALKAHDTKSIMLLCHLVFVVCPCTGYSKNYLYPTHTFNLVGVFSVISIVSNM